MDLSRFPRRRYTEGPTPLELLPRFSAALAAGCPDGRGPEVWVKRDDMLGLFPGGNKTRKLEFLVADALASGATVLVSEGAVQSNHARMTAAAANAAGLGCVLVLDAANGDAVAGNLLLDRLLGADVRIVPLPEDRPATMSAVDAELRARGEVPYLVPTGGSVPMGALGYVTAAMELADQLAAMGERPVALYHATGSLGTQAGLVVGARAADASFAVHGIAVSHPADAKRERGADLANATAELARIDAAARTDVAARPRSADRGAGDVSDGPVSSRAAA